MRKNDPAIETFGAHKLLLGALATGAFLVAHTLLSPPTQAAPSPKVQICHFPPGNPDNWHTIEISENAVAKHMEKHGDLLGPCNAVCAFLCNDGNACTIDDTGDCETNGCPSTPEIVDCDDSNVCTVDTCVAPTGCDYSPRPPDTTCAVDNPGACDKATGLCDGVGACVPEPKPGCCLTTDHCTAWDTNRCTIEECTENACVKVSDVLCDDGNACTTDYCVEATGVCNFDDISDQCPTVDCHDNGCDPDNGCYSIRDDNEDCCIADSECEVSSCTTDSCMDNLCVSVPCAVGDACNTIVDCDPVTCEPTFESPCAIDDDPCTVQYCDLDADGCVTEQLCDLEVETCNAGVCEPIEVPCFSMLNAPPDSTVVECIVECETNAGCEEFTCDLKLSSGLGQACLDGDTNACLTIDAYGRDPAQGNCTNICPLPEPEGPDLLLCTDSYCDRHDSASGSKIGPFITDGGYGTRPGAFVSTGGYRGISAQQGQFYVHSYTPAGAADGTSPPYGQGNPPTTNSFTLKDITATHLGNEYFTGDGSPHWPGTYGFKLTVTTTWPVRAITEPGGSPCGAGHGSQRLVAAPPDPLDPSKEELYVVMGVNTPPPANLWAISKFETSANPDSTKLFDCVGAVTHLSSVTNTFIYIDRIRVDAADETIFFSALHPPGINTSDEGLWRVDIGTGAKQQILPLSQNPHMSDFAIGPHDGLLYVLFRGSANPRLEKFDPVTGASIEVLFQNTEDFGSVEFFPN